MFTEESKSAEPMVSVVMIAYNKEAVIEDAIKGVARQRTDFDVELIIMDDCSCDRTAEKVRVAMTRYPGLIRYFRNERNLGLQGNYLEGFRKCHGKYMAICDADDYWCYRRKLQCQVEYMERHPECALTFHRVINYYEESGEKSLSNGGQKAEVTLVDLSRSNFITNLSVVYRRGLIDLTDLPGWILEDKSPDYAMHMLYASKGSLHYFNRPMGVYRKSAGSAWSMTGEFSRLKMSLVVRRHLIEELADVEEARRGLVDSEAAIIRAMSRLAASDDEKREVNEAAVRAGIDVSGLPWGESAGSGVGRKGLLSRVRAAVSRLIPVPKP